VNHWKITATELIILARPVKWRRIENIPAIPFFVPAENGAPNVPENILKVEELEAVRLKDLEGLEQEQCAARMEISRPTFQRILVTARKKIADSLINGKVIHIEGGNFTRNICPVKCLGCGKEWMESFENLEAIQKGNYACPDCGSKLVRCNRGCKGKFCRKNCQRCNRNEPKSD
jgi:predicted DNA-binding protein (UPF0251 family)/DNA-directed RNA polymerase subunit RPC12/RpoP